MHDAVNPQSFQPKSEVIEGDPDQSKANESLRPEIDPI